MMWSEDQITLMSARHLQLSNTDAPSLKLLPLQIFFSLMKTIPLNSVTYVRNCHLPN